MQKYRKNKIRLERVKFHAAWPSGICVCAKAQTSIANHGSGYSRRRAEKTAVSKMLLLLLLLFTRPLPRDGCMAEDHGAPGPRRSWNHFAVYRTLRAFCVWWLLSVLYISFFSRNAWHWKIWSKSDFLFQFSVYDQSFNKITGQKMALSEFKGNVSLVVNVATFWGATTPQYKAMNALLNSVGAVT